MINGCVIWKRNGAKGILSGAATILVLNLMGFIGNVGIGGNWLFKRLVGLRITRSARKIIC